MKTRRHHNNKGIRQIKRGKTYEQLRRIAKRLGIPSPKRSPPNTPPEEGYPRDTRANIRGCIARDP
jgi:hypothetical protein